jgi:hypothetical protein
VDVGIIRWQSFAGKEATLESTGQTYAEVKTAREATQAAEPPGSRPDVLGGVLAVRDRT